MCDAPSIYIGHLLAVQVGQIVVGHGGSLAEMMLANFPPDNALREFSRVGLHPHGLKYVFCAEELLKFTHDASRLSDL